MKAIMYVKDAIEANLGKGALAVIMTAGVFCILEAVVNAHGGETAVEHRLMA